MSISIYKNKGSEIFIKLTDFPEEKVKEILNAFTDEFVELDVPGGIKPAEEKAPEEENLDYMPDFLQDEPTIIPEPVAEPEPEPEPVKEEMPEEVKEEDVPTEEPAKQEEESENVKAFAKNEFKGLTPAECIDKYGFYAFYSFVVGFSSIPEDLKPDVIKVVKDFDEKRGKKTSSASIEEAEKSAKVLYDTFKEIKLSKTFSKLENLQKLDKAEYNEAVASLSAYDKRGILMACSYKISDIIKTF